jgi:5,10-methylenetetrahydromethanopterin reductase
MRDRIGNPDVGIVLGAITVVDHDGDRAREIARREVAMYVDVVGRLDPTGSTDLESFAFAGTPEQVATQARAVLDAGALRVDFGDPNDLDLLVSDVLPRLA